MIYFVCIAFKDLILGSMDADGLKRFYLDNKSMLDKSSEMLRELMTRICRSGNSSGIDSTPALNVSNNATTQTLLAASALPCPSSVPASTG